MDSQNIKSCPLCDSPKETSSSYCEICGYNSGKNEIEDTEKLKRYYIWLKNEKHWAESLYFLEKIFRNPLEYSYRKGGILLGESIANISMQLNLLSKLKEDPDLRKYKSKYSALRASEENTSLSYDYEKDMQKNFFEKWNNIGFSEDYYIVDESHEGKYKAGEIGEIDLLAHHRTKNEWLILEFKRGMSSDKVVGQTLRYMGWVYKNLANSADKINGAIICSDFDENVELSLNMLSDIKMYVYNRIDEHRIELIPQEEVKVHKASKLLRDLSPEQIRRILKNR